MCTSIPECMQRLSHLTTFGGQHGQESKEGESENKEGEEDEERSEEDCEEDPQGRQEEEVSSLWNRRQLDAGEVVGAEESLFPNRFQFGLWRRERVSARHQVKRSDRRFGTPPATTDPKEERGEFHRRSSSTRISRSAITCGLGCGESWS
jgi:hypothetical protein